MSLWDTIREAVIDNTAQKLRLDDGFQARDLLFWSAANTMGGTGGAGLFMADTPSTDPNAQVDVSSALGEVQRGLYTYGVSRPLTTGMLLLDNEDPSGGSLDAREAWNQSQYVSPGQAIVAGFNSGQLNGLFPGEGGLGRQGPESPRDQVNRAIVNKDRLDASDEGGAFKNNQWANLVSGVSDAGFQFGLDPLSRTGQGVGKIRETTLTRTLTEKNVGKLRDEAVSGTGGVAAWLRNLSDDYDGIMSDVTIRRSADPEALGSAMYLAGKVAKESADEAETAYSLRSKVFLAASGDQAAVAELRATRASLADQLDTLTGVSPKDPTPDLFDDLLLRDKFLAAALGEMDNAGAVGSLVGRQTASRSSVWEANKARRAEALGNLRVGAKPSGDYFGERKFQMAPGSRTVRALHWMGQTRPSGSIRVDGLAADGYTDLQSAALRVKSWTPEIRREWADRWAMAQTVSERSLVAKDFRRATVRAVVEEHGITGAQADDYTNLLIGRQDTVADDFKRTGYLVDDGELVTDQMLMTQLRDSVPLIDLDYLYRVMPQTAKAIATQPASRTALNTAQRGAATVVNDVNNVIDLFWRPLVLMRGGYAPRNTAEAWGRMAGMGALGRIAREQGAEGVANWFRNRGAGVGAAATKARFGEDSAEYGEAARRVAEGRAMGGKGTIDLPGGIKAEGAFEGAGGELLQEASAGTTVRASLRPGEVMGSQPAINAAGEVPSGQWFRLEYPGKKPQAETVETVGPRVVDERPTRSLLHGTTAEFDQFDIESSTWRGKPGRKNSAQGFYFTDKPEIAKRFGEDMGYAHLTEEELSSQALRAGLRDIDDDFLREVLKDQRNLFLEDADGALTPLRPEDATMDLFREYNIVRKLPVNARTVTAEVTDALADFTNVPVTPGAQAKWFKELAEPEQRVVAKVLGLSLADAKKDPQGTASRFRNWSVDYQHEYSKTFAPALREEGFAGARVMDSHESGGDSLFVLPEHVRGSKQYEAAQESARPRTTTTIERLADEQGVDPAALDRYWEGYTRIVNKQLLGDPIAKMLIGGADRQQVKAWIANNKQYGLRREYGLSKADARDRVDTIANYVDELIPDGLRPRVVETGGLSKQEYADILSEFEPGAIPVQNIEASLIGGSKTTMDAWRAFTGGVFKYIGTLPEDNLVRNPYVRDVYRRTMETNARIALRDGVTVTDEMVLGWQRQARKTALRDLKENIYTIERYSNGANALRTVSPFIAATNNTIRTWGKIIGKNPQVIGRANQIWNAPLRAGLIVDMDEDGNYRPVNSDSPGMPLSASYGVVMPIPKKVKERFGVPDEFKLVPPLASMNVALQSDPVWLPGWGPMVTIPFAYFANRNPDNVIVRKWGGYIFPSGGDTSQMQSPAQPWKAALPAYIRQAFNKEDPDGSQRTAIFATIAANEFRKAQATGDYSFFDPEGKWVQKIEAETDGYFSLRIAGALTLPFAANVQDPEAQFYIGKWREYSRQGDVNGQSPIERYIADFGEQFRGYTFSASKNNTGASADVNVQRRVDNMDPALKDTLGALNPQLIGALVNNPDGSYDFSSPVLNKQKNITTGPTANLPFREGQTGAQAFDDTQVDAGWQQYIGSRKKLDAWMRQNQITNLASQAPQVQQAWRDYVAQLQTENPAWSRVYTQRDEGKYAKNVQGFGLIFEADPSAAQRPEMQAVQSYLRSRDALNTYLQSGTAPARTLTAAANSQLRASWEQYVRDLLNENERFADIYFQFFDGEFGRVESVEGS